MEASPHDATTVAADPRHVSYTHLMYGLHAFAVLMGVLTAATIVGQFLFSLPSIVAVIMNYARRRAVRDTWLASHFSWQLRTFWWALLWMVAAWLLFGPLLLLLIGYPLLVGSMLAVGAWVAYRVARGWLALYEERPMPT
jgi:uncharacterized membrane protein